MGKKAIAQMTMIGCKDLLAREFESKINRGCDNSNKNNYPNRNRQCWAARYFRFSPALICERRK